MSWFNRKKSFLPPPPEGYRWHAEEGSGYRFRLGLTRTGVGYWAEEFTEYADFQWTLPWAARKILKQYKKKHDMGSSSQAVADRINTTDWTEQ